MVKGSPQGLVRVNLACSVDLEAKRSTGPLRFAWTKGLQKMISNPIGGELESGKEQTSLFVCWVRRDTQELLISLLFGGGK